MEGPALPKGPELVIRVYVQRRSSAWQWIQLGACRSHVELSCAAMLVLLAALFVEASAEAESTLKSLKVFEKGPEATLNNGTLSSKQILDRL